MEGNRKRSADNVVDLLSDSDNDSDCEVVSPPRKKVASYIQEAENKRKHSKDVVRNPYAKNETKKSKAKSKPTPLRSNNTTVSTQLASSTSTSTSNNQSKATTTLAVTSAKNSSSNASTSAKGLTFNVATYNVWFGEERSGEPHPEERMRQLARVLLERNQGDCPLWFVGFQEVTLHLYSTLKPLLEAAGYFVLCQDLHGFPSAYGCALAVLQRGTAGPKIVEKGWKPFSITKMNRGFLYVRARLPNSHQQIVFTTTHLESFNGEGDIGAKEREQQVPEMETFCLQKGQQFAQDLSLSIITGDLNWDDERPQSVGPNQPLLQVLSSKDWEDSWLTIKEKELERLKATSRNGKVAKKNIPTCYTYDRKENPMLGSGMRRRFDRILIRPKEGIRMQVKGVDLIGKETIPGLMWRKTSVWEGRVTSVKDVPVTPSDHYGYVATLQVDNL